MVSASGITPEAAVHCTGHVAAGSDGGSPGLVQWFNGCSAVVVYLMVLGAVPAACWGMGSPWHLLAIGVLLGVHC